MGLGYVVFGGYVVEMFLFTNKKKKMLSSGYVFYYKIEDQFNGKHKCEKFIKNKNTILLSSIFLIKLFHFVLVKCYFENNLTVT